MNFPMSVDEKKNAFCCITVRLKYSWTHKMADFWVHLCVLISRD